MTKKEALEKTINENTKVKDAAEKIKENNVIYNLNRIYRYNHSSLRKDIDDGYEKILFEAKQSLFKAVQRIIFIRSRVYALTNIYILYMPRNKENKTKSINDMTTKELIEVFTQYYNIGVKIIYCPESKKES